MKLRVPHVKNAGEIAVAVTALAGWLLTTAGMASPLAPKSARALWLASIGILLLSLCGWKFLFTIVTNGLYVLTRNNNG